METTVEMTVENHTLLLILYIAVYMDKTATDLAAVHDANVQNLVKWLFDQPRYKPPVDTTTSASELPARMLALCADIPALWDTAASPPRGAWDAALRRIVLRASTADNETEQARPYEDMIAWLEAEGLGRLCHLDPVALLEERAYPANTVYVVKRDCLRHRSLRGLGFRSPSLPATATAASSSPQPDLSAGMKLATPSLGLADFPAVPTSPPVFSSPARASAASSSLRPPPGFPFPHTATQSPASSLALPLLAGSPVPRSLASSASLSSLGRPGVPSAAQILAGPDVQRLAALSTTQLERARRRNAARQALQSLQGAVPVMTAAGGARRGTNAWNGRIARPAVGTEDPLVFDLTKDDSSATE